MWGRRSKVVEPRLLDAEVQHRAAPRTFSIPRRVVRESLRPGDLVKPCFVVEPPVGSIEVERMWVEVVEVSAGRYVGRLDNDPGYLKTMKADDRLRFGPEHVVARDAREGDPLYTNPDAFAVVSGRVWTEDLWPRRLERHVARIRSSAAGSSSPATRVRQIQGQLRQLRPGGAGGAVRPVPRPGLRPRGARRNHDGVGRRLARVRRGARSGTLTRDRDQPGLPRPITGHARQRTRVGCV